MRFSLWSIVLESLRDFRRTWPQLVTNDIKEPRAEVTPVGRFIIWIAGEIGLLRGMDETSSEEDA